MVRGDGVGEDVRVDLAHVGPVAADGADVAALFAALGAGEELGREERCCARGAEEEGVSFPDVLLEQARVFAVFGRDDAEGEFLVGGPEAFPLGRGVEFVHEGFAPGEGPVDDVDVVDFGPAEHEGEADVPFRLQAGAEDGDGVDVGAAVEDHGCCERCAEGCQFFGVEESVGNPGCGEEGQ